MEVGVLVGHCRWKRWVWVIRESGKGGGRWRGHEMGNWGYWVVVVDGRGWLWVGGDH